MTSETRLTNLLEIDPETARRFAAFLDGLDLARFSIDELKEELRPIFTGYATYFRKFRPGLHVYRAVRWPSPPAKISQISYPPTDRAQTSRANRAGRPLFYGAIAARNATLFEQRLAVHDSIAIGLWESTAPIQVAQLGHRADVFGTLGASRQPHWELEPRSAGSAVVDEWLARRFCERVLAQGEQKYKLTAAIAEKFLDSPLFEGVLYPSIETKANADNLALKPDVADSKLRLVSVEFVQVEAQSRGIITLRSLNFARDVTEDGSIAWLGQPADRWRFPGTQQFWRLHMTTEGWRVVDWRPACWEPS